MKYLITSALPYINGVKHLGNIIGSMLPADVYARFLKQQGNETLFICGTDEHGTPAEIAAQESGQTVREYCDRMYDIQKNIYQQFDIAFDYFGRSSANSNKETTQEIFLALDKNGYIAEKSINQVYSIADQRYLPDRYVIGTCPHCHFDKARGDQCDQCGQLLDPIELINPRSSISGSSELENREEKHLFLSLEKLDVDLRQWLAEKAPGWPAFSVSVANKWLNEGLQSRCISRDLNWGIPIPKSGYENKVFYVWFDAPMAYIAMTKDWAQAAAKSATEWQRWWLDDNEETFYVQFMAKDNLPFHSIMWPAMLLGTHQHWKTVDMLKGFHWLTYEGGKFSTSQNRGIFSDVALELFSADYWRYYLLANIPESQDSDFKLQDFIATTNKDLVGTLGNFVNRVAALMHKYFDDRIPEYQSSSPQIQTLTLRTQQLVTSIYEDYAALNFRSLMRKIRELWCLGNEFITEAAPWTLAKTDLVEAGNVLVACLHLIRIICVVSYPVIPSSAEKIVEMLPKSNKKLALMKADQLVDFSFLNAGDQLTQIGLVFEKISPEKQDEIFLRFSNKTTKS